MFERIANSFALARSSWQVIRTDKQLLVFPITSGVACLFVLLTFALPFVAHPQWLDFMNNQPGARQPPPWFYAVVFVYYLASYFVIIFCNAALVSCAFMRFHGQTPTVGDGFRAAMLRLPQIFAWAVVSATVGLLLKAVENVHEKAGAIISAILGTVWTVLTYFVVPVLVVEGVGPIAAVKRSTAILRKAWGEAVVGQFGLGFYMLLMALPGIALVIIGFLLLGPAKIVGVALLVFAVLYFILLSAVSTAMHGVFVAALYQYAADGDVPAGFDQRTIKKAFAPK